MPDRFEQNDSLTAAKDLGEIFGRLTETNLSLDAGDQDWFKFTLSASQGRLGEKIAVIFDQAKGDIDLELYSSGGGKASSSSTGLLSNEEISLAGKSPGTYYLRVFGKNGVASLNYDLSITLNSFKYNNRVSTAADLGFIFGLREETDLSIEPFAASWFKFSLSSTGTSFSKVWISPSNAGGDIDMELYGDLTQAPNSVPLVRATNSGSDEISLEGRPAGIYFLKTFGKGVDSSRNYALQFKGPPEERSIQAHVASSTLDLSGFAAPFTKYIDEKTLQNRDGSWRLELSSMDAVYAIYRLEGYARVIFHDHVLALDIDSIPGQAYRIYKAAFGRVPDKSGLGYWIAKMDSGMNVAEASARFIDSAEFRSVYGSNSSDSTFLTRVYQNVLGREPESTGYNWWLNAMRTNPEKTRAKVLADFSESTENKAGVAEQISKGIKFEPYKAKEFTVIPATLQITEGAVLSFEVLTLNINMGDELFYYIQPDQTRGITALDFVGGNMGKFAAGADGRSAFSIQILADNQTEGPESFSLSITMTTNAQIVSNSVSITIIDTFISPVGIVVDNLYGG